MSEKHNTESGPFCRSKPFVNVGASFCVWECVRALVGTCVCVCVRVFGTWVSDNGGCCCFRDCGGSEPGSPLRSRHRARHGVPPHDGATRTGPRAQQQARHGQYPCVRACVRACENWRVVSKNMSIPTRRAHVRESVTEKSAEYHSQVIRSILTHKNIFQ